MSFTSLTLHHPTLILTFQLGVSQSSLGNPALTSLPTSLPNYFWMTDSSERVQVRLGSRTLLSQMVFRIACPQVTKTGQPHSCAGLFVIARGKVKRIKCKPIPLTFWSTASPTLYTVLTYLLSLGHQILWSFSPIIPSHYLFFSLSIFLKQGLAFASC